MLFAAHDLLKDAPFSRMELISCRNLLIYLNREAQTRVLDILHFALRPRGLLFLGSSESVQEVNPLFAVLDKEHRICRQIPAQRLGLPVPSGPNMLLRALEAQQEARPVPVLPGRAFDANAQSAFAAQMGRANERIALGELHFRLLERFAPPSILVNREHDIVHLSESAGRFLQFAGGEPTTNLLRVVHPMLRTELRGALFQANETGAPVEVFRVPVDMAGAVRAVDLRVAPANDLANGFLLVTLELREGSAGGGGPAQESPPRREPEPVVRQLERELEVSKSRLRDTVEQYEANTEEMKASNEELQAMNEELRSASEELETSREELQSINEELSTVNYELKSKLEELGRANSDMHNLMAATPIATVFLDRELKIMRYTPGVGGLFNLIPSDIGRPLMDLRLQLDYPDLNADAARVLDQLVSIEREVWDNQGHWFLARILPYRTQDDRIGGVVVALVDITEIKRAREALQTSEEQFRRAIEDAPIPIILQAEDGEVLQISKTWTVLTGYTLEDVPTFEAWLNRAYGAGGDAVRERVRRSFARAMRTEQVEFEILTRTGERRTWLFSASSVGTLRDGRRFVVGMAQDITERLRSSQELKPPWPKPSARSRRPKKPIGPRTSSWPRSRMSCARR